MNYEQFYEDITIEAVKDTVAKLLRYPFGFHGDTGTVIFETGAGADIENSFYQKADKYFATKRFQEVIEVYEWFRRK